MKLLAITYAMVALLTFGYAASNPNSCTGVFARGPDCRALSGILGGAAWPLYWSWEAFDAGRAALEERGDG